MLTEYLGQRIKKEGFISAPTMKQFDKASKPLSPGYCLPLPGEGPFGSRPALPSSVSAGDDGDLPCSREGHRRRGVSADQPHNAATYPSLLYGQVAFPVCCSPSVSQKAGEAIVHLLRNHRPERPNR